jgi:hypothetical protein
VAILVVPFLREQLGIDEKPASQYAESAH